MEEVEEIKKNLIARIKASNDTAFLRALETIMNSTDDGAFQLSKEQENSIKAGRSEIEKGEFIENERLISEMREWLKNG